MAAFPWKTVITVSLPVLIDKAANLFSKASIPEPALPVADNTAGRIDQVSERVARLEGLEVEQAKLLKQTLEELQKVSVLAAGLQARANAAVIVATVAILSAVAVWVIK